jgi:hypothetical protein
VASMEAPSPVSGEFEVGALGYTTR